jgi:hypothetical protein
MVMSQSRSDVPISREDIKKKLGDLQGETLDQVGEAKSQLLAVAAGIAVTALVVVFLLGRRGGRRSSAIIEVRRS